LEKDTTEIDKLTERIAKDPKSKLFVPLAEEYKKIGDIEMAIQVLTDGLKSNPGYVTARSFLGRLLLDRGDLAGAQKELEEVIKAIPDNLLAQRKLGDIYVLQGRGSDAQQRYKAAFALNPSDKELPSLLADLEAGKDVSARIPRPKAAVPPAAPQAAPATTVQQQPKAAAASAAKTAGAPAVPPAPAQKAMSAAPVPPKTSATPAAPSRPASPEPTAVPVHDEAEVIEDIIEIESLEKPVSAPEARKPAPPAADAFEVPAFDMNELPASASADAGGPADVAWGAEAFSAPPAGIEEEAPAVADEGGDDLNTDTLAELYISQGFYDKAIEIYQGMLGDRPDNKALQQKLESLRALAGAADTSDEGRATIVPGPGEYVPPAADAVQEPQPPAAPPAAAPGPAKAAPQVQEPAPVAVALDKVVREAAPETMVSRGPQAATVRRKETIDRLESWLSNIMKEKK